MCCITEISTLHEVPGRLRYFVPQIKSSEANAVALKEYLKTVPGVYHAKACSQLGTLIIYFDGSELTKESLAEHIHSCQLPDESASTHHAPPSSYATAKRKLAGGRRRNSALLMELVGHGLRATGSGGSLGAGITVLRTLLTVASRAR